MTRIIKLHLFIIFINIKDDALKRLLNNLK